MYAGQGTANETPGLLLTQEHASAPPVLLLPQWTTAGAVLQTEKTAVDFFNAKLERYPNHLGRYVLWAGAQTLYGVPEHPEEDPRKISVASWL